jgi:hypothetical protein
MDEADKKKGMENRDEVGGTALLSACESMLPGLRRIRIG